MNIKKIVSVLIILALVAGFAAIGASANTVIILNANAGWPSPVVLRNTAPEWDSARIEWAVFTGTRKDGVYQDDGYTAQRTRYGAAVTYSEWTVETHLNCNDYLRHRRNEVPRCPADCPGNHTFDNATNLSCANYLRRRQEAITLCRAADPNANPPVAACRGNHEATLPARPSLAAVRQEDILQIFRLTTAHSEQLHIRQNGNTHWHGQLRVRLSVTAVCTTTSFTRPDYPKITETGTVSFSLVSMTGLNNALAAGQRILDQSRRYNNTYLAELERLMELARFYLGQDVSESAVVVAAVQAQLEAHIAQARQNYFLLFNWRFLTWLAPAVFGIIDFFSAAGRVITPIFNFGVTLLGFILRIVSLFP
jgi:hypothetical protein